MSTSPAKIQEIDPWYDLYITEIKDPESLDLLIQPSVERFLDAGYQTAIVSEKLDGFYHFHVIAVVSNAKQGASAQIVSQKAREIADHHQIKNLSAAEHEPNQVSFF